ncbi:hypothetical protein ACQPWY_03715 [Pseudonocardia xinjiangensis]|uniref:hypothetical protein n=1 Tax=Pseudonocardia xinjiangensis TaxID=75289 RepID=UPI003D92A811
MTDPGRLAIEALKQVSAVLGKLTVGELEDLVAGRGQLVYQSAESLVTAKGSRRRTPTAKSLASARSKAVFDAAATAAAIKEIEMADEIVVYLEQGKYTIPNLRDVAAEIGPTVVLTGRRKGEIIRDIADGVAGYRQRSVAMSGGAWG